MRPPRDDVRRFLGGALALGAGPPRAPARRLAPDARAAGVRRRTPDRPDRRRALLRDRPHSAGRHRGRGVRVVRHGDLDRLRGAASAAAGALVEERGVRWAFGVGAAVALGGARLGWLRRDTFRAEPIDVRASVYPPLRAPVAQGTERRTSNPRVGGSNPPGRIEWPANCGCFDDRFETLWAEGAHQEQLLIRDSAVFSPDPSV